MGTDRQVNNTRPRLVVVTDYAWPTGGIEEFVCELVARIALSYDCRVISWSREANVPQDFPGLRVIEFGDVRQLWSELDAAHFVVVVASFNLRLLARVVADYVAERDVPTLTVVQTSGHSNPAASSCATQERWLASLCRASDTVVAVSEDVREALEQIEGFPEQRTIVIENAARLHSVTTRQRGLSQVSFIGRPHPQKGYDIFERLVQDLSHTSLRFAANTVSVRPETLIGRVEYSYLLSDAELQAFFDAADLILAPYTHADGLPLALLEALNCGVPIIGFDAPGVGRLLRRYGQVVVEPEYLALRAAVEAWHTGRLAIRAPAAGTIDRWDRSLARYMEIFDDALAPGT